jgi:L-cysteate sulfo-lyase
MRIESLPRFPLAQLPTPIAKLEQLTQTIGIPKFFIKRDDQTGLALGGNKTRKLEFLVGHALARGADTLVTLGGAQSNHCRQTAAAAVAAGLQCELILNGTPPEVPNGNLLLNELLGANIHWIERSQRAARLKSLDEELRAVGRKPYLIPVGGSNGIGAVGYVVAMLELMEQLRAAGQHVDTMVFGSSSGGTQAGIALGARIAGFSGKVIGISIDKSDPKHFEYEAEVAQIANECAEYIGSDIRLTQSDINVAYGYKGEGYGVVGDLEREAIRLLARTEGIILDPVYAGRAFGGMLDLVRKGKFQKGERVLFWHTGGTPALFAHADAVSRGH